MSEFKFACPVCGQHLCCDSTKSGSPLECPTCFRRIVVPQAGTGPDSKLVLTAAQVSSRPATKAPANGQAQGSRRSSNHTALAALLALVVVAGVAAGAVYAFRDKLFKPPGAGNESLPNSPPVHASCDSNWTLKLADRKFPETHAAGRINGRDFALERATVQGGVLSFRQGSKTPQEVGVTIHLFARRSEDLSGKSINIDANRTNAPKVVLRWKDEQEQPVTQTLHEGYALRLEFGQAADGRLPGKILLCAPDEAKSWMAGSFEAKILKPPAPKPPKTQPPAPPPAANP